MRWRLVAACLLATVLVLAPEGAGPPGELRLEGPTGLVFEGENLVIIDRGGQRKITVGPEGHYFHVEVGSFPQVPQAPAPDSPLGRHLAWEQGLEGTVFTVEASDVDQEAWSDPWRSLVLWNSPRGALVLEALQPAWFLRVLQVLWPLALGALAVVLGFDLVRAVGRWLRGPGPALRVTLVVLPLVGMVVVLAGALEHQGTAIREAEVRHDEMVFLGQLVGRRLTEAPITREPRKDRGYSWSVYRVDGDLVVPRPQEGQIRTYLAALRSGRPQVLTQGTPTVPGVLVPVIQGTEVTALVEVRWDGTTQGEGPGWLWLVAALVLVALVHGVIGWLVARPQPRPGVRPLDAAPRRWLEAWGPDLLAPVTNGLPLIRRVVVVSWPADVAPEFTQRLGEAGVVEVDAHPGVRRGLSPRGVAPLVPLWNEFHPRWLRVEVKTLGLGVVDAGHRLFPLTTLPGATTEDRGLVLDVRARRLWPKPKRVGEESRSLV